MRTLKDKYYYNLHFSTGLNTHFLIAGLNPI